MQNELTKLIQSANKATRFRGHIMGAYCGTGNSRTAGCQLCGKLVTVDTKPAPNGIDIHGEAVALNCHPRHSDECNDANDSSTREICICRKRSN